MRVVVTGARGFSGQHLARHLVDHGDQVLGFGRQADWPDRTDDLLRRQVELVAWDLTVDKEIEPAFERLRAFRPEAIYHLAALSTPDDCGVRVPNADALAANVSGTAAVVDAAARLPSPPCVLLISSCHIYDPGPPGTRVNESSPLAPATGYSWSKRLAEVIGEEIAALHDVPLIIARPFHYTGPGHSGRMMLPSWAIQYAQASSEPVQVRNRSTTIDLSDARDMVRAYRLLMERGRPGEIYNVGSEVERRNGDLLALLAKLANQSDRPVVELSPGLRRNPIADCSKLRAETGWQPTVSLEQCVADTLEYWRRG